MEESMSGNGRMIRPYSLGLNKPLRTSSQVDHIKEDKFVWLFIISFGSIRRTQYIPELGLNYNGGGFYLVVFLVGVRFSGGLLFYSSVPPSYFDIFSYHILFSSPFVHLSHFVFFSYLSLIFSLFSSVKFLYLLLLFSFNTSFCSRVKF